MGYIYMCFLIDYYSPDVSVVTEYAIISLLLTENKTSRDLISDDQM